MFSEIWGADAGDIVTSIYTYGFSHPPGFPLYNMLGQIFRFLPIGAPVQRIALISFMFWFFGLLLSYININWFIRYVSKKSPNIILSAVAVLFVYLGHSFLLYALTPEIYTLTSFLIVLNSYYLLRFLLTNNYRDHLLFWLTLLIGIFHQYILILSIFVYLYFQKKSLVKVLLFLRTHYRQLVFYLGIALLPYLLNYVYWNPKAPVFWEPKNLSGLLSIIFRKQYGFFSSSSNSFQPFFDKFNNLWYWISTLNLNYTFFGLIICCFGIYYGYRYLNRPFQIILTLFLLYGPFFIFYFDANISNSFSKGVLERYFLLSMPFLSLFFYLGFFFMLEIFNKLLKKLIKNRSLKKIAVNGFFTLLVIVFPLFICLKSIYFIKYLSHNQIFKTHVDNLFKNLPKESALLLSGDLDLFPAQYYHHVMFYRPDVLLIKLTSLKNYQYQKNLKEIDPKLILPKNNIKNLPEAFIKLNLSIRPFFTDTYLDGFDLRLTGHGLVDRITLNKKPKIVYPNLNIQFLTADDYIYPIHFLDTFKKNYSNYYYNIALRHLKNNSLAVALRASRNAYSIDNTNITNNNLYALILQKNQKCELAKRILKETFIIKPNSETALILANIYAVCDQNKKQYYYWQQVSEQLKLQ